jgi:uncharacterized OB-fold protein
MYRSSPVIRWRRYPERYRLEGNQCRKCGQTFYPKKALCPCGAREFKDLALSGQGKLLTFTEISSGGEAFSAAAPYCLGIVELKEGPKLTAQIAEAELGDLKIGLELEASFRKFYESGKKGVIHYGLKFSPRVKKNE